MNECGCGAVARANTSEMEPLSFKISSALLKCVLKSSVLGRMSKTYWLVGGKNSQISVYEAILFLENR